MLLVSGREGSGVDVRGRSQLTITTANPIKPALIALPYITPQPQALNFTNRPRWRDAPRR